MYIDDKGDEDDEGDELLQRLYAKISLLLFVIVIVVVGYESSLYINNEIIEGGGNMGVGAIIVIPYDTIIIITSSFSSCIYRILSRLS